MEFELGPASEEFLESDDFKNSKVRLEFVWDIKGGTIDKAYVSPIYLHDQFPYLVTRTASLHFALLALKLCQQISKLHRELTHSQ